MLEEDVKAVLPPEAMYPGLEVGNAEHIVVVSEFQCLSSLGDQLIIRVEAVKRRVLKPAVGEDVGDVLLHADVNAPSPTTLDEAVVDLPLPFAPPACQPGEMGEVPALVLIDRPHHGHGLRRGQALDVLQDVQVPGATHLPVVGAAPDGGQRLGDRPAWLPEWDVLEGVAQPACAQPFERQPTVRAPKAEVDPGNRHRLSLPRLPERVEEFVVERGHLTREASTGDGVSVRDRGPCGRDPLAVAHNVEADIAVPQQTFEDARHVGADDQLLLHEDRFVDRETPPGHDRDPSPLHQQAADRHPLGAQEPLDGVLHQPHVSVELHDAARPAVRVGDGEEPVVEAGGGTPHDGRGG